MEGDFELIIKTLVKRNSGLNDLINIIRDEDVNLQNVEEIKNFIHNEEYVIYEIHIIESLLETNILEAIFDHFGEDIKITIESYLVETGYEEYSNLIYAVLTWDSEIYDYLYE